LKTLIALIVVLFSTLPALADEADVEMVSARQIDGLWQFDVTATHPDTGADHMLNSIGVFTVDGKELAQIDVKRPSVGSATVTYRIPDVLIPKGLGRVIILAQCSVDGWAHSGIAIDLR